LKIAGLVKNSLIDYPEKIAAVIFTQGCNFRCGFCHNPDLLEMKNEGLLEEAKVIEFLKNRKNILDGVVITGGEPTLQPDLVDFIKKIKENGYAVKLDTNGSNPAIIKKLIDNKLIDYVAMDLKGPFDKYPVICGYLNKNIIQESIEMLMNNKIEYEFRSTILPYFHNLNDIREMAKMISGAEKFTLQSFRPGNTWDKKLKKEKSFSKEQLEEFEAIFKKQVKKVRLLDNL
jgi:pyruvate formate lyase activating enzyme